MNSMIQHKKFVSLQKHNQFIKNLYSFVALTVLTKHPANSHLTDSFINYILLELDILRFG